MGPVLKMILYLSLSGTAMAALLFIIKPLCSGRVSRRFWYYIWLPVLIRLCLPVAGVIDVSAAAQRAVAPLADISAAESSAPVVPSAPLQNAQGLSTPTTGDVESTAPNTPASPESKSTGSSLLSAAKNPDVWLGLWLLGAIGSLGWNLAGYLKFSRRLRRSAVPAGEAAQRALLAVRGHSRRPRLMYCPLVSTPMLVGVFSPVIILPETDYSDADMENILLHELSHYRRGDLYFKWFAMLAGCVHWFNPTVYLIRREINRACEPACDEDVICRMEPAKRRDYGKTLLNLAAAHRLPVGILATTMSEEKAKLKGRLISIMSYKKISVPAMALSLALALLLCACGSLGAGAATSAGDGGAAKTPDVSAPLGLAAEPVSSPDTAGEQTPLTADEIKWFNTEFFGNKPAADADGTYTMNIHNWFLTSIYERPEDIDLFQLFYCGTPDNQYQLADVTEEERSAERQAVLDAMGAEAEPDCYCQKNTVADMDKVLTENMGLTLKETNGVGLDSFTYLPEYDAYYYYHGDTNYMNSVMTDGYTDGQGRVYLHYENTMYITGGTPGSMELCLEKNGDGYLFVYNKLLNAVGEAPDETPVVNIVREGTDISADYPVAISPDDTAGVGVNLIHSGEDKIIFYGYFGLYVYDLGAREITLSVDFMSSLGSSNIQGSVGVAAEASPDGGTVLIYSYSEDGENIGSYYINTADGSYSYAEGYTPLNGESYDPIVVKEGEGLSQTDDTLSSLTFTRNGESWKIFEGFWD